MKDERYKKATIRHIPYPDAKGKIYSEKHKMTSVNSDTIFLLIA